MKKLQNQENSNKSYKTNIAANGRINIPAKIRQLSNIAEGDEVIFEVKDQIIHLIPLKKAIREAQELAALVVSPLSLTEELQLLRQEELGAEARHAAEQKEQ